MNAEWQYLLCQQYLVTKNMSHAVLRLRDRGLIGRPLELPCPESVLMALRKYLRVTEHLKKWPRDRLKHRFDIIEHHVRRVFQYEKRNGFTLSFMPQRAEVVYNTLLRQCVRKVTEKMEEVSKLVTNL